MIFGHINTTCDISKLSQILLAKRLVKFRIILKYNPWYLSQIPLQIMLLPILILKRKSFGKLGRINRHQLS